MAFNFKNNETPNSENYALFNPLANGTAIVNNQNYLNPIESGGGGSSTPTVRGILKRRERTPEPPPAPNISRNMKPNQGGGAPMDIENDDCEIIRDEIEESSATKSNATSANLNSLADANKKLNSTTAAATTTTSMTDLNLFLNGFPTGGYMFFPAAAASTATAANAATMLMDPTTTTMMAGAMQQLQQAYPSYALTAATDGNGGRGAYAVTDGVANAGVAGGGTLKEIIKTKHCMLFPPNPDAPPPTIRERPPGCRTVFVGGLPENVTEEIVHEIFESCGEITTLRMSKKNFCHIRYRTEDAIEHAIYLSGYRLRIADASDPMNYGRLHVDYAQARDDQYDFECKQRQQLREQRHRERMAMSRSESPPPIPHYTDHEASLVSEHLRSNDTFLKSVQTITVWLERGDCTKRNANAFYSMIQSTHAHVRRLYADKQTLEQDLRKARELYRKQMLTMSTQFTQIEKVFSAASHKKVWDHFTKAQRKNIDQWKKLATDLRSVQIEDDEMEMSDDDRDSRCSSTKRARHDTDTLKDENDSLRCQLDAMRNEVYMNRSELRQDSDFREKQIKVLQETIRNMQTQLLQTKMREQKDAKLIEKLECELKEARVRALLLQTQIKEARNKQKEIKTTGRSSTANSISNDDESRSALNDEESLTQTTADHESSTKPQEEETETNHIVEINETEKDKENQATNEQIEEITDEKVKENSENVKAVDINEIVSEDVVIADDEDEHKDDDDDVRFVDVENKQILAGNGLANSEIILDDNDDVVLVEEEDEKVAVSDKGSDETLPITNSISNEVQEDVAVSDDIVKDQCDEPIAEYVKNTHESEVKESVENDNAAAAAELKSLLRFEARIITLTAAYLVVQPSGALTSSICLYLSNFLKSQKITEKLLDEILNKYENLFMLVEDDVSVNNIDDIEALTDSEQNKKVEKENRRELKWKFCGFMETEQNA